MTNKAKRVWKIIGVLTLCALCLTFFFLWIGQTGSLRNDLQDTNAKLTQSQKDLKTANATIDADKTYQGWLMAFAKEGMPIDEFQADRVKNYQNWNYWDTPEQDGFYNSLPYSEHVITVIERNYTGQPIYGVLTDEGNIYWTDAR